MRVDVVRPQCLVSVHPPSTGQYQIDTFTSDFNTVLDVTTHSSPSANACNDDAATSPGSLQLEITLDAAAGVEYSIRVGGYGAAAGNLVLHVLRWPPPINDDRANAIVVAHSAVYRRARHNWGPRPSSVNSTPPCVGAASHSVWYRFTPDVTANYSVNTFGSDYDSLYIYSLSGPRPALR